LDIANYQVASSDMVATLLYKIFWKGPIRMSRPSKRPYLT
jgi:hypothetical protein